MQKTTLRSERVSRRLARELFRGRACHRRSDAYPTCPGRRRCAPLRGSLSRVAERIIAAYRQHDSLMLVGFYDRLAVPAGVELSGAVQHHEDVIFLGMGVQRVFSDTGGVTMDP